MISICARLSSEHYTTDIDSTVAMVIDMSVLINEPPQKLRNPTLENIIAVQLQYYGHFFRCTVVQDRIRTYDSRVPDAARRGQNMHVIDL